METRARYVLVGFASLMAVAIAFGLLMFSLKRGDKDQVAYYAIDFSGSVAGLSIGNDVRFNGIKVGEVRSFTIDQNDPSQVRVIISMAANTPVRQDSEASLSMQGITGLAVVDITGGSSESPRLPKGDEHDMPIVKSRRSTLSNMIEEAPNLLHQANDVMQRGSNILSEENQDNVNQILKSLAMVSTSLERQNKNLEVAIENMAQASQRLNKVMTAVENLVDNDLETSVNYLNSSFKQLHDLVGDIAPGARRLTGDTADEILRVLGEAQEVLRNMNTLVNNLNSDPQRLFFGDNIPGIRAK